jgi:hypothetical protein
MHAPKFSFRATNENARFLAAIRGGRGEMSAVINAAIASHRERGEVKPVKVSAIYRGTSHQKVSA